MKSKKPRKHPAKAERTRQRILEGERRALQNAFVDPGAPVDPSPRRPRRCP